MDKDNEYNIKFLPPTYHGSRLTGTPTVRDVIQMHEELASWIKSKEPKPKEKMTPIRLFGWIMIILWLAPVVTLVEYQVLRILFPNLF